MAHIDPRIVCCNDVMAHIDPRIVCCNDVMGHNNHRISCCSDAKAHIDRRISCCNDVMAILTTESVVAMIPSIRIVVHILQLFVMQLIIIHPIGVAKSVAQRR